MSHIPVRDIYFAKVEYLKKIGGEKEHGGKKSEE